MLLRYRQLDITLHAKAVDRRSAALILHATNEWNGRLNTLAIAFLRDVMRVSASDAILFRGGRCNIACH